MVINLKSKKIKIKVILFGATGMVGEGVLHESLKHPEVEKVLVIGRKTCRVQHPKLQELLHHDFFNYMPIESQLRGYNACFFCLGVSSLGMNEKDYARITYELTLQAAASLSKINPDMTFCYVSGAGTDSTENGRIMWARIKGKTENHLQRLPFKAAYMFRPGFIRPTKGLKNAYTFSWILSWFYPLWKTILPKYVCTLEDLGLAMIRVAGEGYSKIILENKDITQLASSKSF
jgi:uncharacterized protein YbjT (DUF2867 family)